MKKLSKIAVGYTGLALWSLMGWDFHAFLFPQNPPNVVLTVIATPEWILTMGFYLIAPLLLILVIVLEPTT